jgi:3-hydroxyisobutyrate dehydrogenase-like beta-hydroxyacid dehydrogenase
VLYGDPKAHLFTLRNCRKDIGYYTKLTDSAPTTALVANAVKQTYEIAYALGKGDLHMPMLGDVLAELNNSELPKPGP